MSDNFSYSVKFTLDKPYYTECFEQSVVVDNSYRAYAKAIFFTVFGGALVLFTEINPYAAWFVFALGIVEALSVYYQKPWWVLRQMLSKAAKSEVQLTIDDKGIFSHSFYIDDAIAWHDIKQLSQTDLGWLIQHTKGKNYLSQRFLTEQVNEFLHEKSLTIASHSEKETADV